MGRILITLIILILVVHIPEFLGFQYGAVNKAGTVSPHHHPIADASFGHNFIGKQVRTKTSTIAQYAKRKTSTTSGDLEDLLLDLTEQSERNVNLTTVGPAAETNNVVFPEVEQAGIDEKKLRASPFGKILFGILDRLFPVFKEPNWFDVYDAPLSAEANLDLPYFDGYDFVNST